MSYTIGKRMTTYAPRPYPDASGQPGIIAPGSVKVGSFVTMNAGIFHGSGSYPGPAGSFTASSATPLKSQFNWMIGGSSIANATNNTFQLQTATTAVLACRMSVWGTGVHAQWGTYVRDFPAGTVAA